MRRLLSLGIPNPSRRLATWATACIASSLCVVFWWPLGAIPFAVLCVAAAARLHRLDWDPPKHPRWH